MQFKVVNGNRIQLVAYRGHNKEKKRPIVKTLGAIYKDSLEPVGNLMELLDDDEKQELARYVERTRRDREIEGNRKLMDVLPDFITGGAGIIKNKKVPVDNAKVRAIRKAIAELTVVLDEYSAEKGWKS